MTQAVVDLLSSDPVLASLASENIGWAAEGCPAVSVTEIDGTPSFIVEGCEACFVRISCVAGSFTEAMAMHRRVQALIADLPNSFLLGGNSSEADRSHTVNSDFEVWSAPVEA